MLKNWLARQRSRRLAPRPASRVRLNVEALESRLAPAGINVLTFHDDSASTGLNLAENLLSPANVRVGSFGKLFTVPLDGQVYAQPLIDTGVTINPGPYTSPGVAGIYDVVFAATEHDTLYAIDARPMGGAILWQRSFLDIANAYDNTLGASAITTVLSADVGTNDINPEIGITGTPVIDASTGTLYVVTKTKETIDSATHFVQRLHAINISDGTDVVAPFLIGDTALSVNINNTPIYVYGSGDGNVVDPYNNTGKQVVQFEARREHQRGALSLVNGTLYVPWASHGDNGPYHGWVVAWDVSQLATSGWALKGVLNTTPNAGLGGIWQGSGRLAFEADGSAFYFETGNGGFDSTLDANGLPFNGDYGDSLIKAALDPTTTPSNQNVNGWGLKVVDYFTPHNQQALDDVDQDFGSGAPLVLPDAMGIAGHPHLLVAGGKEGRLYLVDRDNMGKFNPNSDHVVNASADTSGQLVAPVLINGLVSTAAYYNGKIYAVSGYSGPAKSFIINPDGTLAPTSSTTATFGYLPGSPSISAAGATGGIVWVMDTSTNRVHAYDAATFATELWNSGQKSGGADALGAVVKFAVPTEANGELFIGTANSLVVYGLVPPANAAPDAPVNVTATTLSGSSVSLAWQDNTAKPNTASGYAIEASTDNITFTQLTTASAGLTSVNVGGLQPSTLYYFRIRGFNGVGFSPYSNVASAATTSQVVFLDFSGGFAGSASKLTFNSPAAVNGTKAELTDGGSNEAGSFFSTSAVDITRFSTQFTFQISPEGDTADGFTFTVQNVAPTAVGLAGGGLGYGPTATGGSGGLANSVAIKFDLYDNQGEGPDSTGLYTNGAALTNIGSIDLRPTGIDLHSGDFFQVNMTYDGTTLAVIIKDTQTGATATQNYTIDIPGTVGQNTAYVGFTGGTGGVAATQDILTWAFAPSASQAPAAPTGLGGQAATATTTLLTWTGNATNQTGFHLDRATDAAFTQNLITENLPATPSAFTDTATGLAPGGTYYYRLRAFNAAGESASSNTAIITIPLAPPTPTNAKVVLVSATEIDLTWTDNARRSADGYRILRQANNSGFVQVANLPAVNVTSSSSYPTWADTQLTRGTYYEYHVIAYNTSGNNDFTGTNATTISLPPTGLTATAGAAFVNLSWAAPIASGPLTYNIYRGSTPGAEGTTPLATGLTTTAYKDTTPAGTNYYTVTAVNANATQQPPLPAASLASNEASAQITATSLVKPVLADPGGPIQNATPTFAWNAVVAADSYDIWMDDATSGKSQVVRNTSVTGTTMSLTSPLTVEHTFTWWLRAFNHAGVWSPWSAPFSFTVTFLDTPVPIGPAGSLQNATPTFTWKSVTGADHYDLWVNDLTTAQAQAMRSANVPGTSLTPATPLTSGHTYQWWVRAMSSNGDLSPWTGGTTFALVPLDASTAIGPTGSIGTAQPTLTWSAVPGADFYDLWVNDAGTGQSQVVRNTNVAATSFTTALTFGHFYQWWLRGMSSNGASGAWSATMSFKIALATPVPGAPTGPISSASPSYSWSPVPGADFYDLWVDDATTGQSQVVRNTAVSGTSVSPAGFLTPGHSYRWWVRAYVVGGDTSPWSSATMFNVVPLASPVPVGPVGATTNATPTFSWGTVTGADFYDLWVDDITTGQAQVVRNRHVTATSYTSTAPLTTGDRYQWWVRALSDNGGAGAWSSAQVFTIVPSLPS